jgi:precorrin-6A/cobalt-precorrin-6A reductase
VRVLVLAGTGEASALVAALHARKGIEVVSSLAGRTRVPVPPPGRVRSGGFGGAGGLAAMLGEERIDAVVDATHPFAARITAHAAAASAAAGVPLVVLRRPGWTEGPGDDWRRVPDLEAAAALLPGLGERVFLATGRGRLAPFAALPLWFLLRTVDPPGPPLPARCHVVLARGPFALDGERALLREHRVDVVVTKDSGGTATAAKLVAARERGLSVVVVDRPPLPAGVVPVASVGEALARLGC